MKRVSVVAAIVLALPVAALAQQEGPDSGTDSPEGQPPGVVGFDTPPIYRYRGENISEDRVDELELACMQTEQENRCYSTPAALENGEGEESPDVQCAGGWSLLFVFRRNGHEGRSAALKRLGDWANLSDRMNNVTSSYVTGDHRAHLAEKRNGYGYWYPGDTSRCANDGNMINRWNNRVSSRKRLR